jgi:hypothetical protein
MSGLHGTASDSQAVTHSGSSSYRSWYVTHPIGFGERSVSSHRPSASRTDLLMARPFIIGLVSHADVGA